MCRPVILAGFPTLKGGASQNGDGRIFLRGMDENRLDIAKMPLQAEIGVEAGVADASDRQLDSVADLPSGEKAGPYQVFGIANMVCERAKNDLAGAGNQKVDLTRELGSSRPPICRAQFRQKAGSSSVSPIERSRCAAPGSFWWMTCWAPAPGSWPTG